MNDLIENLLEKLFSSSSDRLTPRPANDFSDVEDLTFSSDDYQTQIPYFSTNTDFDYFNTVHHDVAREQAVPEDPEAAQAPPQDPNAFQDPNAVQDPNMMQPQVDQYGQPVPGTEMVPGEIQDPDYLGKIYELKKIYSRLVSIESFLDSESDPTLLKLRNYVSSSIELFQMLINNIHVFRENIDELIVTYYKFLLEVYSIMKEYYKKENAKLKKEQEK